MEEVIARKEEELEKFKLEVANLLNKNEELCEDINELEESLYEVKQKSQQELASHRDSVCWKYSEK